MNYSEIIQTLNEADDFDLFRLSCAINNLLQEPRRVLHIKKSLKVGQELEYFDAVTNRPIVAHALKLQHKRVVVQNRHDNKRWSIPYYSINIRRNNTDIHQHTQQTGLNKNALQVGDSVGFHDRKNVEHYGTIVRLNDKTATLDCRGAQWRVAYSLLFKVLESEQLNRPSPLIRQV